MAKKVEVDFSTDWVMNWVVEIPSDWEADSEKTRDYCYEQLLAMTRDELIDRFVSSLEGGLTIEHIEEI